MYKVENLPFDFDSAELACVYIEKYKTWEKACVSLHPNVECKYISSEGSIPVVEIKINEEYDLFQQKGINVKVIVGENGCGKSSLLDVLSSGRNGGIAILKDSAGNFGSNKEIKIRINDTDTIFLNKHLPSGFESINDGFLLNVVAENTAKHRIKEVPLAFAYCFLPIYQENPDLYNFKKDDFLFTHFSIKTLPTFKDDIQNFFNYSILSSRDLHDDDFEDAFRESPVEMILLSQMTSDKYWHDFNKDWFEHSTETEVYFGDLIEYQGDLFFKEDKISELISKYNPQIKALLWENNAYKEYNLKEDFSRINTAWMGKGGLLDALYNDLIQVLPDSKLNLFYYYGFKCVGTDKFDFDSFSGGEKQSLLLKYEMYPGIVQNLKECRFWHVLDEPETSLHPEWSRLFWKNFLGTFNSIKKWAISLNEKRATELENGENISNSELPFFENDDNEKWNKINEYKDNIEILKKRRFSIIISTHSPFILSDLFSHNIVYLEKQKRGNIYYSAVKKSQQNTFAGNIGEMFYDYFLKNAIGAIAEEEIINAVKYRQKKNPDEDVSPEKDKYEAVVNNIGDPVIRSLIEEVDVEDSCEDNDGEEK